MENKLVLIISYEDLMDAFINTGHKIKSFCQIRRRIFSVVGTLVKIDDFKIQIYEYPDEAHRKKDLADAIQARRFSGNQDRSLTDEIHCWSIGKLNVLYIGSDRTTIRKVKNILGLPYLGMGRIPSPLGTAKKIPYKK